MHFDQTDFARRLRDARVARGLTQEGVDELIGKSKAAVSQYENGHTSPDYELLTKLAELYGRTVTWLLSGEETESEVMTREQYELFKRTSELPPQIQEFVLIAIEVAMAAKDKLPQAILANPTPENWLAYAEELYKAYKR